jgi:hypothetical protein
MTKREALRQTHQENTLLALGFTHDEAEALRRISMTLHRWHELECGTDSYCIVRGAWNQDAQTFDYDDNGRPHYEFAGGSGRTRYMALPDREKGAKRARAVRLHPNRSARRGALHHPPGRCARRQVGGELLQQRDRGVLMFALFCLIGPLLAALLMYQALSER